MDKGVPVASTSKLPTDTSPSCADTTSSTELLQECEPHLNRVLRPSRASISPLTTTTTAPISPAPSSPPLPFALHYVLKRAPFRRPAPTVSSRSSIAPSIARRHYSARQRSLRPRLLRVTSDARRRDPNPCDENVRHTTEAGFVALTEWLDGSGARRVRNYRERGGCNATATGQARVVRAIRVIQRIFDVRPDTVASGDGGSEGTRWKKGRQRMKLTEAESRRVRHSTPWRRIRASPHLQCL